MSEHEQPTRLADAHRATIEDIRALSGPTTPHFALQVRTRILRLIEGLPADDPARIEGEREAARLTDLANHSGDPRGPGPAATGESAAH